jgi:hypothetical protein
MQEDWKLREPKRARLEPIGPPNPDMGICANPDCPHHTWLSSSITGGKWRKYLWLEDDRFCVKYSEKEKLARQKTPVQVQS